MLFFQSLIDNKKHYDVQFRYNLLALDRVVRILSLITIAPIQKWPIDLDIYVVREILSSEYQPYACGKIVRTP
jgi:hypothetical protein